MGTSLPNWKTDPASNFFCFLDLMSLSFNCYISGVLANSGSTISSSLTENLALAVFCMALTESQFK